jgi:uncharacterized SAM-dependent methyltransferase
MKYFRNTELAKLYNISEKTVRNWIEATQQGKLSFQLHEEKGKHYIVNISKNTLLIEQLVAKGKKYKNTRGYKVIQPRPDFYELFDSKEIFNIMSDLDIHHEVSLEYSYFDGGAKIWDGYVRKLAKEDSVNILSSTISLLSLNMDYIDGLLQDGDRINIIDIGPGNAYPVRKFLEYFVQQGKLGRYIGIDASRDMLNIAKRNLSGWFGDSIPIETYVRDITYERFGDLLAKDSFSKNGIVKNVVLFLGSTLSNFRDPQQPLTTIRDSMGKDDLLILSKQLDTQQSRRYFDYYTEDGIVFGMPPKSKFVIDLFNIDESLYDIEPYFDEVSMERRLQVRLRVDLSIEFTLEGRQKMLSFNKGDVILLWRHAHQDALHTLTQFDRNGFNLLQATTTRNQEYLLAVFKVKRT